VPQRITVAQNQLGAARSFLREVRDRYAGVSARIEASGLNKATGLLLRREFNTLPDSTRIRRLVGAVTDRLEDAEFLLVEREAELEELQRVEEAVDRLINAIDPPPPAPEEARAVATELVTARKELMSGLVADARELLGRLIELDTVARDALEAQRAYESYIRERILWVPSIPRNRPPALDHVGEAAWWFFDAGAWREGLSKAGAGIRDAFVTSFLAFALLLMVFIGSRVGLRRLRGLGDKVSMYRTDALRHTVRALGITLVGALPLPLVLYIIGWALERPEDQVGVAFAVGFGLEMAAFILLPLEFLRLTLRPHGLAERHFRWPIAAVRTMRRHLRWLMPIVVPAVATVVALDTGASEAASASLGRVAFTVGMLAFTLALHLVLRPGGPLLGELLARDVSGWLTRTRYVWYPLMAAVPIALVVLAWLGFYYTAIQLSDRLASMIALVIALVTANGVLLRWLFIARRRVAVEEAKRRRDAALADAKGAGGDKPTESTVTPVDADALDLPAISQQTRQLFKTAITVTTVVGLYLI